MAARRPVRRSSMIQAMATVEGVVGERRSTLQRAWQRVGRRADGRPPLWIELAVIGWLFWLYDVINDFAPVRQMLALRNAAGVLSAERWLHLAPELTLNRWLGAQGALALVASYYYFFAHAVLTFAVLAWLWWRRPSMYPRLRLQLVIVNLIAFVVFWRYPLAPPRMLPGLGYNDVIASSHALVSWHSGALVHDADQFAAMPSLHVAWAMWCGIAIWQLYRRRAVAVLAIAYPVLTALIVVATGNHYLLDVVAGAGTVLAALALHRALEWALASLRRRRARVAVLEPADRAVRGLPGSALSGDGAQV
jgi:membrane-associated phospholipid phosphatase